MNINQRPTLSPEMLLFEVAAMASRHGLAVSSSNPSAALHYAGGLLRSLGLEVPPEPPRPIESAPPRPASGGDETLTFPKIPAPLPVGERRFARGTHRPQSTVRALRPVND